MKKIALLILISILIFSCKYKQEIEYKYDCQCAPDSVRIKLNDFVLKCLGNPSQSISVSGYKVKKNSIGNRAYFIAPQCMDLAKEIYCPRYAYVRFWKGGSTITDWINIECDKVLYQEYLKKYH